MSVKEMIKKEIDKLPENLLPEVFDFIQFLESKRERIMTAKSLSGLIHCVIPKNMGQRRGHNV